MIFKLSRSVAIENNINSTNVVVKKHKNYVIENFKRTSVANQKLMLIFRGTYEIMKCYGNDDAENFHLS